MVRVIARLNVGGPALHTMHLTEGLKSSFPTLLVAGTVADGEADLFGAAEQRGLPVARFPRLGRELNPLRDLGSAIALFRLLRRERPLIVHTHTAKAGFVGRLAAFFAGVPIRVHTFHGHVFHGYFPKWKTRLFLAIERSLGMLTSRVIAISESQRQDLVQRYRVVSDERICVIPLGLDLERFSDGGVNGPGRQIVREELAVGNDAVVTIVGRLEPIKNHRMFLRAARELASQRERVHFVVVGGGTLDRELRGLAHELKIADRVHFLGWRYDLERIYAASDVVVLTSDNEGTPVCLIEALSAGRPVVARAVGGVADVLQNGRLGTLVDSDSPERMADAIAAVLDDPNAVARAQAASAAVRARYGVDRLLRDISALYDDLLSSRGLGRTVSSARR